MRTAAIEKYKNTKTVQEINGIGCCTPYLLIDLATSKIRFC